MKMYFFSIAIAAAMLSFTPDKIPGSATPNADANFITKAVEGGMLEIKLGKLAQNRAASQSIKDFGKMIADDHSVVSKELWSLAKRKRMETPMMLSGIKQVQYDSLAAASGEKFDQLFMKAMLSSHEEAIMFFENESVTGKDQDIRKWANSQIPSLKSHLEMARTISEKK